MRNDIDMAGDAGPQIRTFRKSKNLTQQELAEKVKIPQPSIAKIEGGGYLPRDLVLIGKLEDALDIPKGQLKKLISKRRKYSSLAESFPHLTELCREIVARMNDDQLPITIVRVEKRLDLFKENKTKLAENLISFLFGNLSPEGAPDNGLRPLIHYYANWNDAIEQWDGSASCNCSYTLPGRRLTAGLCGEPDRDNSNV